ncbi:cell wall elongation regulator TseB-like domain-containing protein [Paenibacillus glufosinatiresistens]|uniref:cell wall elongation regulator TseB-like domain-containing protein n=1 Tax=Paenibacillus glufosinatiresistens TaxID=3070657 RepID=UPI00286E915F|nr:DUF5590 domain-containing protein [Paenibacillus sp. YX.27]
MRTKRKWVTLGIVVLILLAAALYAFYAYVLNDQRKEQRLAENAARSSAGLTKVVRSDKSVWDADSIYWVVTGDDKNGKRKLVWVKFTEQGKPSGEPVHTEDASSGLSRGEMSSKIASALPRADIRRLLPGVYYGEYVWQAFYKMEGRYYYQFYRFADGEPIGEPYALPNR